MACNSFGGCDKSFSGVPDSEQIMKWGPVKQLLKNNGNQPYYLFPYVHYKNMVEKYVRTIMKAASTIIHGQCLLKASLWNYALFYVAECCNVMSNKKRGSEPDSIGNWNQVTGITKRTLIFFVELIIVCSTNKTWKFDVKYYVVVNLGHPKGSVHGGIIYYPYTNKIAEHADITPENNPEEVYKQYFARRYEI
jgi:hypothetical protein